MFSDICFFNHKQGKVSLCPSLDYLSNVIEESAVQTASLQGCRQLSIIRREEGNFKHIIIIYNYRYSTSTDSFGVCLVFKDYYPCGINYLFSFMGKIIAKIVREGKVLYVDKRGFIQASNSDIKRFSAVLKQHIDHSKKEFNRKKAELVILSSLSSNYYSIYRNQTIVHQLSDDSWAISEDLEYNNIVIITEEIEEENINSMRSFIKKSNETVDDLNKKIKKLEEQLKKSEREKKKQSQTKPPHKQSNKPNDNGMDTTTWITLGVIGAIILLNVIAPWFFPSVWPKLSVVFTILGTYVVIKALNDDSNKKIYEILGWSGAVAILLSTVLTIYGLCGGFSPDTVDEGGNVKTVTDIKNVPESEQENITTIPAPVTRIPNNFVRVSSGESGFYIDKYEVTQKDYAALMGNNPSKYQGDSLPVHGMSVRDAVIYCNRKSEADGLRGFYDISGNVVVLKSDGNGYRLPTEKEWIQASKKTKENVYEKAVQSQTHAQDVKRYDFKPHTVGEIPSKRRELFDVYGNVSELCVRSNGEIWGKGGSYRIALSSETSEDGGLKAAENLSCAIHLNADFGLRLVFIP